MRVLDPKVPKAGSPSRAAAGAAVRRVGPAAPGPQARAGYAATVRIAENVRSAAALNGTAALRPRLRIGRSSHASEAEATRAANAVTAPLAATRAVRPPLAGSTVSQSGPAAPSIVQRVLAKAGQPLEGATRRLMESRFGADFGAVRVHRDGLAAESARAVGARAYTVGQSIAFGHGEYAPQAPAGSWLLAHELAHTLQQKAGGEPVLQRFESYEHVYLGDKAPGGGKRILLRCHELDFPAKDRSKPFAEWPKLWRDRYVGYTHDQRLALQLGLTYGEIVALVGDLYASFNDLNNAPLKEVMDLIVHVRNSKASSGEFQKASGGRYADLALKNVSHFSSVPTEKNKQAWRQARGVGISSNMEVWREQHRVAIDHARAGRADLAWGTNAGADHFLSDAFSAGHIRTPRADLLGGPLYSRDVQSKVLHDLDNAYGVEVVNAHGQKWIAYGDDHLAANQEGRDKAIEALELSKKDVADALARRMAYPDPATIGSFPAEGLVPKAVDPAKDRWTGRTPTYVTTGKGTSMRLPDDYSKMESEIKRKEGPGAIKEALFTEDNLVVNWVEAQDIGALGRQPVEQKIRMLNTLIDGWISGADMKAIEKILDSVTASSEMVAINVVMQPRESEFSSINQRMRFRVALARRP